MAVNTASIVSTRLSPTAPQCDLLSRGVEGGMIQKNHITQRFEMASTIGTDRSLMQSSMQQQLPAKPNNTDKATVKDAVKEEVWDDMHQVEVPLEVILPRTTIYILSAMFVLIVTLIIIVERYYSKYYSPINVTLDRPVTMYH